MSRYVLVALLGVGLLAGCERSSDAPKTAVEQKPVATPKPGGGGSMSLTVRSSAFDNNTRIPEKYTGDGQDISPPLTWSGVPEGTKELALICDDPDAPMAEPWVHWVIYKLPPDCTGLPENVPKTGTLTSPTGGLQGANSWGKLGYGGPAPPPGPVHHYHFKLYALDAPLNLGPGADKKKLLDAMKGHTLAEGEFVGTYQR